MNRRDFFTLVPGLPILAGTSAPNPEMVFDGAKPGEPIRALHGVNGGPLAAGGLLDLSARWKEAAFPLARLHDSHWPIPDVVDVRAVFPNPDADPADPANYDFERSDEYVKAVHDCGARIVYRLGESIEHQKAKRRVRPPKDFDKWAAVCAGIVRHYTRMKLPVAYWEIWNEPDNRPNCWTGTDEDYLRLYVTAARALREEFPSIKIGGPGLGNPGDLSSGKFTPTAFLKSFLARCREERAPLDFLSWHCYTFEPLVFVLRAAAIRTLLDKEGFKSTESHLNEWNFLPDGDWSGLTSKEAATREKWYARVNSAEGAAFVAASLIALQDAHVDAANYFTAEAPGMGLFSQHGVPSRAFGAFLAFKELSGLKRLPGTSVAGVSALAGVGKDIRILLVQQGGEGGSLKVVVRSAPWNGGSRYEILGLDAEREWGKVAGGRTDSCEASIELPPRSVRLLRLWKE